MKTLLGLGDEVAIAEFAPSELVGGGDFVTLQKQSERDGSGAFHLAAMFGVPHLCGPTSTPNSAKSDGTSGMASHSKPDEMPLAGRAHLGRKESSCDDQSLGGEGKNRIGLLMRNGRKPSNEVVDRGTRFQEDFNQLGVLIDELYADTGRPVGAD